MKRHAFTLIELLVVIAIIAILAAILFPVFARAKESAKKTSNLNNVKQVAISTAIYMSDYNDTFPRAFTIRQVGTARWNVVHPTPENWKALDAAWSPPIEIAENAGYWANAVAKYTKNWAIFDGTGFTKFRQTVADGPDFANPNKPAQPESTHMTYNGLLHTLTSAEIEGPSIVPMYWGGNGQMAQEGRAIANPALRCDSANVTEHESCRFNRNGPVSPTASCNADGTFCSAWFWVGGTTTAWSYTQGFNQVRTDTSAKFQRAVNANVAYSPGSGPWASMGNDGVPATMWGCRPAGVLTGYYSCFFRPDRTQ